MYFRAKFIKKSLTLLCLGEEKIYLDNFDVKLRKKLLCTLFLKKISIPAETKNESFLTSCSTSKNDVLTYIFNDLTSKVGPRRHSVAPISPERGKNLPRCGASQHSNQLPVPRHTECGGWRVRALSLFLCRLIIQRTVAGEFPKPQRSITFHGGTRQDMSLTPAK